MIATTLPPWLKPGAVIFHAPTRYLFVCDRVLSNGANYRLCDAPKGIEGNAYELSDCRPATPDDCNQPTVLFCNGQPLSIAREKHPRHGDILALTDGDTCWGVQLSIDLQRATQSLAWFFQGEVVEGDADELLEALGA